MEFDEGKYKIYTWKSGVMLHWILNPGLAINELLFGQRIPKVSLEEKASDKPRIERSLVPCPHCETLHDGRTWSYLNKTGFKNWFGLYCPNCGEVIPCLLNVFSFLLLVLTYPIWGWFKRSLKRKWLAHQPQRFESLDLESIVNPYAGLGWVKQGLSWGMFMFIIMSFIFPLLTNEQIRWQEVLLGIPIWLAGGLLFGYWMKYYMGKKGKEQDSDFV